MQKYTCPCCGYMTLESDGYFDICEICFWEDDPYQKFKPYDRAGANPLSLAEAQHHYMTFGACEPACMNNVRKPNHTDIKDPGWRPIQESSLYDPLFELKLACTKFNEGLYSIADLSLSLTWITVPNEVSPFVKDAANRLERIGFCTRDYKQQEEADEAVKQLLRQLNIKLEE